MENYNNGFGYGHPTVTLTQSVSKVMRGVYMRMCLGLIVTALTAFLVAADGSLVYLMASNRLVFWGLIIAEFGVVLTLAGALNKLSSGVATLLFYAYAVLNGAVLSMLFYAFSLSALAQTFFITAGVFGAMTVYGYFTKSDLTKMGTFLFMALIGLIICSVVNMFLASSSLDWIISFAGVAIFIGLTAWDTQKIKTMIVMDGGSNTGKIATIGALSLYLDFINLFLYLLRFFGGSRN